MHKENLQSDFAEGCENSGRVVRNRDTSRLIPKLSGNPDLTRCIDRKSLHRSPFTVDEQSDGRKQDAHRYSAHQDANDGRTMSP